MYSYLSIHGSKGDCGTPGIPGNQGFPGLDGIPGIQGSGPEYMYILYRCFTHGHAHKHLTDTPRHGNKELRVMTCT